MSSVTERHLAEGSLDFLHFYFLCFKIYFLFFPRIWKGMGSKTHSGDFRTDYKLEDIEARCFVSQKLSFPFHEWSKERIFGKCKEENMNFFQWLGILTDFAFCQQITEVFIACYRFIYSETKNKLAFNSIHILTIKSLHLFHCFHFDRFSTCCSTRKKGS